LGLKGIDHLRDVYKIQKQQMETICNWMTKKAKIPQMVLGHSQNKH